MLDILTKILETTEWVIGLGLLLLIFFTVFYDIFQKKHAIMHNFPLVGRVRYVLELIGPELRQYWVANDKEEMPFNRSERRWIYTTSKNLNNNFGFGTTESLYQAGYPIIKHSQYPFPEKKAKYPENDPSRIPCLKVMGQKHKRKKLFRPQSVINISGMSFGALSARAVEAMNQGAAMSHCYQNTGEGGMSNYHNHGGNIMLQLGTAYFSVRDLNGKFSMTKLKENIENYPAIRAIEIKLSQGAKPGKGGILPASKVSAEIAKIRGIEKNKECISPNAHSEFSTTGELIDFIENIADETGLPVGIKSAVGGIEFWKDLAEQMKRNGTGPDFITIDGGEGGTGAAPLAYTDHVSLPFKTAFSRVYSVFQKAEISDHVVWIGSGKLGFPDRSIVAFAMGCDIVHVGREAMMSIGCIQSQNCHTGKCPTGVATQNRWLQAGLNVEHKAERFKNYIEGLRKELISLSHAAGYEHPAQFTGTDVEIGMGQNRFETLENNLGYKKDPVNFTTMLDYTDYS